MPGEKRHAWRMVNVRNGYLVTEGCAKCGARLSFFSIEDAPPKDSYVDGKHIWKYRGSAQAIRFDLENTETGDLVKLDPVVGLMLCTGCTPDCPVNALNSFAGDERVWAYIALCPDTTHMNKKCVGPREIEALEGYFNQGIRTPGKSVRFVSCDKIPDYDTCQAEIIADTGLTEIY